jgi:hypothetical protein
MSMGSTPVPVTGYGPFEFTDSNGKHVSIPLTALTIANNQLQSSDPVWSNYLTSAPAQALAKYMVAEGLISPTPAPSPFPAMIIRAANAGTAGNNITVLVTVSTPPPSPPIPDPTQLSFSIQVSETDTYANQTPATIASTLAAAGGLVQVVETDQTSGIPDSSYTNASFSGSPAQLSIDASGSPGGTLFVLGTRGGGADALNTYVTITTPNQASPPSSGSGTFTLKATWQKTVNNITLDTLASVLSELSYVVTISKPSSGAYSVPAAGSTTLSGGNASSNASASLFTSL